MTLLSMPRRAVQVFRLPRGFPPARDLALPVSMTSVVASAGWTLGWLTPGVVARGMVGQAAFGAILFAVLILLLCAGFAGTGPEAVAAWFEKLSAHQRAAAVRMGLSRRIVRRRALLALLPAIAYLAGVAGAVLL